MSGDTAISAGAPWTFARVVALVATLGALLLVVWPVIAVHDVVLLAMLSVLFAVMLDGGVRAVCAQVAMPRCCCCG